MVATPGQAPGRSTSQIRLSIQGEWSISRQDSAKPYILVRAWAWALALVLGSRTLCKVATPGQESGGQERTRPKPRVLAPAQTESPPRIRVHECQTRQNHLSKERKFRSRSDRVKRPENLPCGSRLGLILGLELDLRMPGSRVFSQADSSKNRR